MNIFVAIPSADRLRVLAPVESSFFSHGPRAGRLHLPSASTSVNESETP